MLESVQSGEIVGCRCREWGMLSDEMKVMVDESPEGQQ
jgi:hypothetical protein